MSNDPEDTPVLKPLNEEMRCSLLSNTEGKVMIAHDKEIASEIQWIEYDPESDHFHLIHEDGLLQELGLHFDKKTKDNVLNSREVVLVLVKDKTLISQRTAMIVIKEY